jgi:hypothetical protein
MVAFRCYSGSSAGERHDDAWRAALPPEFNSEVDTALEVLQRHRTLDDKRYFKPLRRRCNGLTEIRIDFELELDDPRAQREVERRHKGRRRPERPKIILRILGFGTADDFVLLYGFQKRGEPEYGPACHAALNRKAGVERDGRRAPPSRFP